MRKYIKLLSFVACILIVNIFNVVGAMANESDQLFVTEFNVECMTASYIVVDDLVNNRGYDLSKIKKFDDNVICQIHEGTVRIGIIMDSLAFDSSYYYVMNRKTLCIESINGRDYTEWRNNTTTDKE